MNSVLSSGGWIILMDLWAKVWRPIHQTLFVQCLLCSQIKLSGKQFRKSEWCMQNDQSINQKLKSMCSIHRASLITEEEVSLHPQRACGNDGGVKVYSPKRWVAMAVLVQMNQFTSKHLQSHEYLKLLQVAHLQAFNGDLSRKQFVFPAPVYRSASPYIITFLTG